MSLSARSAGSYICHVLLTLSKLHTLVSWLFVTKDAKTTPGVAAADVTVNVAVPAVVPDQISSVATPPRLAGTTKVPATLPFASIWGSGTGVMVVGTPPLGEVKVIWSIWAYAGNPAPVKLMVCPGPPCVGDSVIEAPVKVNVPTAVKAAGAPTATLHPEGVTLSLTTTLLAPEGKPAGTRALRLNVPPAETGALKVAVPIWTLTDELSEFVTVLVVGIHPDPVTVNNVLAGPDTGVTVTVGVATVQVVALGTLELSVATTVYVPGFSGGTTRVVVILPLEGIVTVWPWFTGAGCEPKTTLESVAPGLKPDPSRVTVLPATALLGVIVSACAPTVISALAELAVVAATGPETAYTLN